MSDRADVIEQEHRAPQCPRACEIDTTGDHVLADFVPDEDRLRDAPVVVARLERRVLRVTRDRVEADGLARFEQRAQGALHVGHRDRRFAGLDQVQEGLVDFMVSGTAIWGSVAPKLQVFDFPFLWRDWDHVHHIVDTGVGHSAADYLEATVRMRPLAWGDSFGFRQVVTRSRDVTAPGQLSGLKIRTIQSPIYVKAIELMGASPTPMAFGEVYTSLQTGVIDGYEHDASTTVQQRFYEVAHHMARTRHIAGVLGLFASSRTLARLSPDIRAALERAAREASAAQRAVGPREDSAATTELAGLGMTIRDFDARAFRGPAEQLWEQEARALGALTWLDAIRA